MQERWKRLEEFPSYAISTFGQVSNVRRDTLLSTSVNQQGVLYVALVPPQGRQRIRSVALLSVATFRPRRPEPFNSVINLDGNRRNCRLDNLLWRPRNFTASYFEQFRYPWFHIEELELEDRLTGRVFRGYRNPCVSYGIRAMDIIKSYTNGDRVFPTRQIFRRL